MPVLSDDELDHLVYEIHCQFPMCGNVQMQGPQGYRVQQVRVRESLRRIDPEGCIIRRLNVINRHQYRVSGPRSLWHIDGNHFQVARSSKVEPLNNWHILVSAAIFIFL